MDDITEKQKEAYLDIAGAEITQHEYTNEVKGAYDRLKLLSKSVTWELVEVDEHPADISGVAVEAEIPWQWAEAAGYEAGPETFGPYESAMGETRDAAAFVVERQLLWYKEKTQSGGRANTTRQEQNNGS